MGAVVPLCPTLVVPLADRPSAERPPCAMPRPLVEAPSSLLSPIASATGLERLIVICVGLDAVMETTDALALTRSVLYRALTRAHMMVLVVNEYVRGGWLEFFPRLLEYYPQNLMSLPRPSTLKG